VPSKSRDEPQGTSPLCASDSHSTAHTLVTNRRGSSHLLNRCRTLPLKIRRDPLQRAGAEFRTIPCRHRAGRIPRYDEYSRFDDRFDYILMHRLRMTPVSRIGQSRWPCGPQQERRPYTPIAAWNARNHVAHQAAGFGKNHCDRFVSGDQWNHFRSKRDCQRGRHRWQRRGLGGTEGQQRPQYQHNDDERRDKSFRHGTGRRKSSAGS